MNTMNANGYTRNVLITGADQQERIKYATSLSMLILCKQNQGRNGCGECHNCIRVLGGTHPNIMIIEPQSADAEAFAKENDIKIEQIRELNRESAKANYEEGVALFVITHMHQITKAAANALLKSIEESGENKIFLALAPSRVSVLPTIASRLVALPIKPSLKNEELSTSLIDNIWDITTNAPENRFHFTKQFAGKRLSLLTQLALLEDTCHALLRAFYDSEHPFHHRGLSPSVAKGISEALNQAILLSHKNVHAPLIVENMLFNHWPYA